MTFKPAHSAEQITELRSLHIDLQALTHEQRNGNGPAAEAVIGLRRPLVRIAAERYGSTDPEVLLNSAGGRNLSWTVHEVDLDIERASAGVLRVLGKDRSSTALSPDSFLSAMLDRCYGDAHYQEAMFGILARQGIHMWRQLCSCTRDFTSVRSRYGRAERVIGWDYAAACDREELPLLRGIGHYAIEFKSVAAMALAYSDIVEDAGFDEHRGHFERVLDALGRGYLPLGYEGGGLRVIAFTHKGKASKEKDRRRGISSSINEYELTQLITTAVRNLKAREEGGRDAHIPDK